MTAPPDDDDERTIVRPPSRRPAAAPGEPPSGDAMQLGHMLPTGTRLRDYEITGLIGEGGFGIVYLAWDHSLQRRVAVKEYMPASLVSRVTGSSAIVVKSERHVDTFRAGLKSFVNEARLLARFDHPSLVKVYRFWEENGTAYMVMPYYEGPTLKAALTALGRAPTEDELRAWLRPLLDALATMHATRCYHRDIAPDNVLLTPGGPLLLDFGAARRVIGDMTHALTVVLKPGYAPIEQYGDVATMAQGAWTDLYALACVVYYAITGRTPTSSVERLMDDAMQPLSMLAAGRYSPAFLRAIDAALSVRPQDRPQDVAQFRALLDADLPPSAIGMGPAEPAPWRQSASAPLTESPHPSTLPATLSPELPTHILDRAAGDAGIGVAAADAGTAGEPVPAQARRVEAGAIGSRRGSVIVAGGVLLLVLGWALVYFPQRLGPAATRPATSGAPASTPLRTADPARRVEPPATPPTASTPAAPRATVTTAPAEAASASTPVATPIATVPDASSAAASVPRAAAAADLPPAGSTTIPPPAAAPPSPRPAAPTQTSPPPPRVDAREPARPVPPTTRETARPMPPATRETVRPVPPTTREPVPSRPAPSVREPDPSTSYAPYAPQVGARCSDILQKASLEPLTAEEAAYLKRECR